MEAHYFVQALFALAGILALLAALFNWNWFFTSQNARPVVLRIGRPKARLFYGVLGVIMIALSVYFYMMIK